MRASNDAVGAGDGEAALLLPLRIGERALGQAGEMGLDCGWDWRGEVGLDHAGGEILDGPKRGEVMLLLKDAAGE